jgi:hypothetical protein
MLITKDEYDNVAKYLRLAQENRLYEFEARVINKSIDVYRFSSVVQYLRSKKFKYITHDSTLDVSFNVKRDNKTIRYRYSIPGQANISSYCRYNDTTTVKNDKLIIKSLVEGKNGYYINDYNMKVNLKSEEDIQLDTENSQEIKTIMKCSPKTFRLKKRFSFETDDGLFRYDLTVVKESPKKDAICMADSGLDKVDDTYEFELEYIGHDKKTETKTVLESFFKHFGLLLCLIDNDDYIMRASEKNKVLNAYDTLVKRLYDDDHATDRFKKDFTRMFIGPMPTTLERKNIIDKTQPWIETIKEDYTVTEKADGERFLMFITQEGLVYIINNRFSVKNTGLINKVLANSIIDGEYITRSYTGMEIKLYTAFDVYVLRGKDVRNLPLMDVDKEKGRINLLETAFSSHPFEGKGTMRVKVKQFYDQDIFVQSGKLLDDSKLVNKEYYVDGLIFTPKKLPVGAAFDGDKAKLVATWSQVYKWKPPEDNTIDFLVKTRKTDAGADLFEDVDGELCSVFDLYVGLNPKSISQIQPYEALSGEAKEMNDDEQIPIVFKPVEGGEETIRLSQLVLKIEDDGKVRCINKEKDVIYDNSVVECAFEHGKWIPLRVRKDKTEASKKRIAANNYFSALNIWRSIQYPVTKDMITGIDTNIPMNDNEEDGVYYKKSVARNHSASYSMLNFHNYWVKDKNMFGLFRNMRNKSIFDIGCAKGNDIHKYIGNHYKTVVGIDKSYDNITNPLDGAYARIWQAKKTKERRMQGMTIVYLPMDFTHLVAGDNIEKYLEDNEKDEDTKTLVNVLWGKQKDDKLPKHLEGLVTRKFDVVACQFAIHYFFEDIKTVEAFINNVDFLIKNGGYFIGTCLDARKVVNLFAKHDVSKGGFVKGETDTKRILWRIRKSFDDFDDDNPSKNVGKQVDVYMETINKEFKEYLVDYQLLQNELAKRNIRPLNEKECAELNIESSTGYFDTLFAKMEKSGDTHDAVTTALGMSQIEKDYSFLNRWFIFKKDNEWVGDDTPSPVVEVKKEPSPKPKRKVIKKKS